VVAQSSLKAALDVDWDDPGAQQQALTQVLDALASVETWLDTHGNDVEARPEVAASVAVAQQVHAQDVTTARNGTP